MIVSPASTKSLSTPGSSLSPVESKTTVLLESLRKFYAKDCNLRVLTDVLRQRTKVSLRIIDWLCTNYAKKYNTHIILSDTKAINLYLQYKSGLRAYSKKSFDPFQGRDRVEIVDADGAAMPTTIGQLNFFRFAIQNGVIDYAIKHAVDIEKDMMEAIRHRHEDSPPDVKPRGLQRKSKRKELSKAAIKQATSTNVRVTLRFV